MPKEIHGKKLSESEWQRAMRLAEKSDAKNKHALATHIAKKMIGADEFADEIAELFEAKTVGGFKSPEPGKLPQKGKDILARVYAEQRKKGMEKERSAKIAWGAVKRAGFGEDNMKKENNKKIEYAEEKKIKDFLDSAPKKMSIEGVVKQIHKNEKEDTANKKGHVDSEKGKLAKP